MWLILQIALGIVLGGLVLMHLPAVLRLIGALILLALIAALGLAVVSLVVSGVEFAKTPDAKIVAEDALSLAAAAMVIFFGMASIGLLAKISLHHSPKGLIARSMSNDFSADNPESTFEQCVKATDFRSINGVYNAALLGLHVSIRVFGLAIGTFMWLCVLFAILGTIGMVAWQAIK